MPFELKIEPVVGKPQGPFEIVPNVAPVEITVPASQRGIYAEMFVKPDANTTPATVHLVLKAPSGATRTADPRVTPGQTMFSVKERFFGLTEPGTYVLSVSIDQPVPAAAAPNPVPDARPPVPPATSVSQVSTSTSPASTNEAAPAPAEKGAAA